MPIAIIAEVWWEMKNYVCFIRPKQVKAYLPVFKILQAIAVRHTFSVKMHAETQFYAMRGNSVFKSY